ncbi:MAG: hypothetical protein ABSH50_00880 [Bryobacteraceae bacterium]|jgi:hypothetical protein
MKCFFASAKGRVHVLRVLVKSALVFAFPCMAMAQIAVLQLKVLEGEGAVHPAGAHITHPLTVEVADETGRPVAGAAVSFQLPPEGPGGIFANGLRTDLVLTDANGRAVLHSLLLNRTSGSFRIKITAVKEQARAGIVSQQYIGGNSVSAAVGTSTPAVSAKTEPAAPGPVARSGEITPTTTKMSSGSHKKWIVIAAIAVGGVVAFVGVSRAAKSNSNSTVSSSTVSVGTPTITIGQP